MSEAELLELQQEVDTFLEVANQPAVVEQSAQQLPVLRRSARLAAKQKKVEAAGQPNGGHATARPRRTCAAKPPGFYKV